MKIQLIHTQLFRGMEENELDQLLNCLEARQEHFGKGEIILPEGEPIQSVGIVLMGTAMIVHGDVWGNNSILGFCPPGSVFGEAYACIQGEPLLISVSAMEETDVLFLSIEKVLTTCPHACGFHTKLIRNLLGICAQKNVQLSKRIVHTSGKSIRSRLLSYFSDCVKREGAYSFAIPYNRQQLADYLSVDRSALCNELSKMQKEGWIRYEKNRFTLLQQDTVNQ